MPCSFWGGILYCRFSQIEFIHMVKKLKRVGRINTNSVRVKNPGSYPGKSGNRIRWKSAKQEIARLGDSFTNPPRVTHPLLPLSCLPARMPRKVRYGGKPIAEIRKHKFRPTKNFRKEIVRFTPPCSSSGVNRPTGNYVWR